MGYVIVRYSQQCVMEGVCHSQVQPAVCNGWGYVIVRYSQQCVVEGVCHSQVQPAVCNGGGMS